MPKINTLVDDIYSLLENGTKSPSQEHLFAMASNIVDSMKLFFIWLKNQGILLQINKKKLR